VTADEGRRIVSQLKRTDIRLDLYSRTRYILFDQVRRGTDGKEVYRCSLVSRNEAIDDF